jgi:exocyst complex component 4
MRAALKRETKIDLEEKGHGPILQESLITPSKKILALGTLYSSLVSGFVTQ